MKKIGFVAPWFGWKIPGGAEMELRGLLTHLHEAGHEVEILTTCVEKFASDWSVNFYKSGAVTENGICVRRFPVRKREDVAGFDRVNRKLMKNRMPLSAAEEALYQKEMVNSPELYQYLKEHEAEYSIYCFIPYMFGTTYFGMQCCPEKSVIIPCLHDESYAYMECFKREFPKVGGMIFHARPESDLANRIYDLSKVKNAVLGEGVYTDFEGHGDAFREKFGIKDPYILYAGRKEAGKCVGMLLAYFDEYKKVMRDCADEKLRQKAQDLKLILVGGGDIKIPDTCKESVVDLGFVELQDKYDAMAGAELLCQPSKHESFSLVIMESWICSRPVLVNGECEVTRNFAVSSKGGLYFTDYPEFEGCLTYLLTNEEAADAMGQNGQQYVLDNFKWDVIVEKYMEFFSRVAGKK